MLTEFLNYAINDKAGEVMFFGIIRDKFTEAKERLEQHA